MKKLNEFDLIEKYFAPLAGEGSFELKDDATLITLTDGHEFVVTQDAIAEGVHFFADDAPELIAKKALRVNLSDLAAKGAKPKSFSLALGLGENCDEAWIERFALGLAQDCMAYGVTLSGGDTFKTGSGTMISITAMGEVPEEQYVSRLSAKVDDEVFVTGSIGDGALGLLARQGLLDSDYLTNRYLLPEPRMDIAPVVAKFATASMDISDGLVGDLEKLCKASVVGAEIFLEKVPLSVDAKSVISYESKYMEIALTGGDDYEILLCVPAEKLDDFIHASAACDFSVAHIGKITAGEGVKVFDINGKTIEFEKTSYTHTGD